jgi:hypothetical protein
MDLELQNELQQELGRDEKLLWTGKPNSGVIFQAYDLFLIPFSLFWCGIIIVTFFSAIQKSSNAFSLLFMTPFLAAGIYLLIGRFLLDARRRKNTIYGITESRIILKSGIVVRNIKSFNIKALSDFTLREKRDGTGSILIGPMEPRNMLFNSMGGWPGVSRSPSLESIEDVRKIYNLIFEIQRKGQ